MVQTSKRQLAPLVLLLIGSCCLLSNVYAAVDNNPPTLGGADAEASVFARSLSGMKEGVRYIGKVLNSPGEPPRKPTKVKLALVGFGRTGTTSLVTALHQLGYSILHDDTLMEVSDLYGKYWKKEINMDEFVQACGDRGFDGIFLFIDDFLDWLARPENDDVQVILSTRQNGRAWAESWLVVAPNVDIFNRRPYTWFQTVNDLYPLFEIIYKDVSTQGRPDKYMDLDTLAAAYDAHLVKVRKKIPAHRLLEFNVKEGWDPLCEFLDKEAPETKFPHVNDKVVVEMMVFTFWLSTWVWPLGPALLTYALWHMAPLIFFPDPPEEDDGEQREKED